MVPSAKCLNCRFARELREPDPPPVRPGISIFGRQIVAPSVNEFVQSYYEAEQRMTQTHVLCCFNPDEKIKHQNDWCGQFQERAP